MDAVWDAGSEFLVFVHAFQDTGVDGMDCLATCPRVASDEVDGAVGTATMDVVVDAASGFMVCVHASRCTGFDAG